ncbi:MAG: glycosyltransferase [Proteobacteria bacterium]|nr:glycosyltransferase [Pseudomonadota bacterium]MBU1710089.1 glycosyltransferase [Pseudomonadota bacterium]
MTALESIIIYRDLILPPSETFIRNQAGTLRKFTPYFIGSRRVPGLELPNNQVFLLNNGTALGLIREAMYKLFGFAPYLEKKINEINPRLVHVHMGKDATLYLPLHKNKRIPLIVTFHGTDAYTSDEWKRKQKRITFKIYLRRRARLIHTADLFIAVSNSVKQGLLAQGYPEGKILVHYIGIDLDQFKPDQTIQREPVVLFVSRLEEFKGCQYLIEAMAEIQKLRPDIRLVVIGDGPYRQTLEKQTQISLKNIEFLGTQPHDVVKEWMNKATVLSVPSLWEGLPTFVQEAMAMGLPMALFDVAPVREALGEDLADCLAKPKNSHELAEKIMRLFDNNDLWQRLSVIGRKRALELFDLKKQTKILEDTYKEQIKKHKK